MIVDGQVGRGDHSGPHDFNVSPMPLELGWTGLGLGQRGFGTEGLRSWLDNLQLNKETFCPDVDMLILHICTQLQKENASLIDCLEM